MSPRQGSPVPHELLPPHIGCCKSSASSIFQPPPPRRTTTSSQHARPSGVLCRRSDGLERAAWRPPRPVAQCRQFQEEAKDASVSEWIWTLSTLEALRNALYKFKTYLLTLLTVPRQTYGYPSHKSSPPIGWYQIILLGDRGTSVWTTRPGSLLGNAAAWSRAHDLLIASPASWPLRHQTTPKRVE